jgi:drug/metabolite transporter (DMT)-like permease
VAATALAFVTQTWAQSQLEPTQAAVILTMEPVFAGLTGFLAGEQMTLRLLLGAAMVLLAMYLVELGPRRSREAQVAHLEP